MKRTPETPEQHRDRLAQHYYGIMGVILHADTTAMRTAQMLSRGLAELHINMLAAIRQEREP